MATIKSYTDLSQSRKLAEILPLESADGVLCEYDDGSWHYEEWVDKPATSRHEQICWSLSALLGVLPKGTRLLKSANISSVGDVKYHCDFHRGTIDEWYDNPVDACVAMIEKLHELKML